MKKLSLASLIVGAIFFAACNGNSNSRSMNSDSTSSMMNSNDTNKKMSSSSDTSKMAMVGDDAKVFSKEAAQGGMIALRTHSQTLSF